MLKNKTLKLVILLATLSIFNRSRSMFNPNEISESSLIAGHIIGDIVSTLFNGNRIENLDSTNGDSIYSHAKLSEYINILRMILSPFYAIGCISGAMQNKPTIESIANLSQLYPTLACWKHYYKDIAISENYKKIADANKNKNLSQAKSKQWFWLLANKLTPYTLYFASRDYDNYAIKKFELIKVFAQISEVIRKNRMYEIALEDIEPQTTLN